MISSLQNRPSLTRRMTDSDIQVRIQAVLLVGLLAQDSPDFATSRIRTNFFPIAERILQEEPTKGLGLSLRRAVMTTLSLLARYVPLGAHVQDVAEMSYGIAQMCVFGALESSLDDERLAMLEVLRVISSHSHIPCSGDVIWLAVANSINEEVEWLSSKTKSLGCGELRALGPTWRNFHLDRRQKPRPQDVQLQPLKKLLQELSSAP
mmetsp:Transcript_19446/g.30438  ORF Transcript_19446/g.30438 Transcript_19446/m.30438 type:complete len:207 (+) Transcript_19446:738-1358(+)